MLKKYDYGISKVCGMSIICLPSSSLDKPLSADEVFFQYYEDRSYPQTPITDLLRQVDREDEVRGEILKVLKDYSGQYDLK